MLLDGDRFYFEIVIHLMGFLGGLVVGKLSLDKLGIANQPVKKIKPFRNKSEKAF